MAYYQASELLENSEAALPDLLDSLERLGIQAGYLTACSNYNLRENCEADLLRVMQLSDKIKEKIVNKLL